MSRTKKIMLAVQAWPRHRVGKLYEGLIKQIQVDKKSKILHVTIENLDPSQSGRIHEIEFPLPIHPGSKTGRFLTAAGQDANTVGKKICIDDAVDAVVGMIFTTGAGNGNQQIEFERIANPPDTKVDILVEEPRDGADVS